MEGAVRCVPFRNESQPQILPALRHWLTYRFFLLTLFCLCTAGAAQAQGPVAYYPFTGNANDQSGNGHHGTVTGATLVSDRFGRIRSAYLFDGNDFITVPHSPKLSFGRDQEFTLAAWVQACRTQQDFAGIVARGQTELLRPGYQMMVANDSIPALDISRNSGNPGRIIGNGSIIGTRWHFVTIVVSAPLGTVRIYIDGRLDRFADSLGLEPNLRDNEPLPSLFIGKERNSEVFFRGAIDDVRIYDRALSDAEVLELYRESGWEESIGPTGILHLRSCPDTTIVLDSPELLPPYAWSTGAVTRSITVNGAGRYLVEGRVLTGCRRTDTFVVTIADGVRVDAGNTVRICRGDVTQLLGTVDEPDGFYTWQWSPTKGLGSSNSPQTTASPTETTTYYLRVTTTGGCVATDSVTVEVDVPPGGRAGDDLRICAGEQVRIGRDPLPGEEYTYRWISGEAITGTAIPRPFVRPTRTGAYVLEIRSPLGCTLLDTAVVTVATPPRLNAGRDMSACDGASVTIGANATGGSGPYSYSWSPATGLSSPIVAMPVASPQATTRYIVTVTDANGCTAADTVVVAIGELPRGGAGADRAICAGEEVRIGVPPPVGTAYTYRWISGEGLLSTDIPQPLVRPTRSGVYVIETRGDAGCTTLDTMILTVHSMPRVDAGPDIRICGGSAHRIGSNATEGSGPYSYSWSPATGLSSASEATPLASPVTTTRYLVTVTDANGCRFSDSVLVEVDMLPIGGAGPDLAICPGDEVEIGSAPPSGETYTWQWISGEGLLSTDIPRPRARPTVTGAYVVRIRNSAGCEILDTMVVRVNASPRADAGPDRQLCIDDAVRIGSEATGGMGPYGYSWSPADGLSSTTEAMPLASPTVATRYTVIVTDARGCRDTSSVMIVPGVPDITVAGMAESGELDLIPEFGRGTRGAICDSVTLHNPGDIAFEIDAMTLARNSWFSIPQDQLPLLIPPHSERTVVICYEPLTDVDRLDTLRLGRSCGLTIPIALRRNLYTDDCGTPLVVRPLGKRTHFKVDAPYPNPASGTATVRIERAAEILAPVPADACRLYSSDGAEVASGTYTPQHAWSLEGMSYERGEFAIAADQLPSGIYHVRIVLGEFITSHALVIAW